MTKKKQDTTKTNKKEKSLVVLKRKYNFPEFGETYEATSITEGIAIAKKERKKQLGYE